MLQKDFVIVLCLIGLLQSPLSVGAEPQLGVPFPDGKPKFLSFYLSALVNKNFHRRTLKEEGKVSTLHHLVFF